MRNSSAWPSDRKSLKVAITSLGESICLRFSETKDEDKMRLRR